MIMLKFSRSAFSALSAISLSMTLILTASQANSAPKKSSKAKTTKTTSKKSSAKVKNSKKTVMTDEADAPVSAMADTSTGSTLQPIITELTLTATTYPKLNTVSFQGTDINAQGLTNVTMPQVKIADVQFVKTILVPQTTSSNTQIDVSVIDDFIANTDAMARHYPPVFPNKSVRYFTTQRLKQLTAWIETYAKNPNASYDILLRAAKLNGMGRNLDLGSDYAIRAGNYIARAIKINDTGEANFLYGMMLSEGGGFKEGEKYLNKAISMGYAEAEQSLAQADLLNDRRDKALERLQKFKIKYPNDTKIDQQIAIVNSGKYYIWDLPLKANP